MALEIADRVKETTTTTGTGTLDLAGASAGFQTFVLGIGNANTCHYCITDNIDFEVGLGTVTDAAPDTLSRDTVISSSNGGAKVVWGSGSKDVFCVLPGDPDRSRAALQVPGKNVIINGDMPVAQRGTSFTGVGASATEYTLDRFLVYTQGSPQARATVTQESGVFTGFGSSAKIDCTTAEAAVAATELWSWQTRLEAQDLQHYEYGGAGAKTLALTFSIKSPKSGIHCVALFQPDGSRSFVREFTVVAADTEETITVTFPGDASGTINNDTGEGLRVTWPLVAGSDFQVAADAWAAGEDYATSNQQNLLDNVANNFEITGIQLEVGGSATDFERRAFAQELALAQRYYQRLGHGISGYASTTSAVRGSATFLVEMRALPTTVLLDTTPTWIVLNTSRTGSSSTLVASGRDTRGVRVTIDGFGATLTEGDPGFSESTDMIEMDAEL